MARGFVYLAAVLDWFSRRVLSWRVSITMEVEFCIEALQEALARIIHEKCAVKAKPLISFTTMRMGCLMKFFAMKSLAQVFGGLGRFRAVR